jgi:alpha-beta hydrolase superfamily lysophospholipase
MAPYVHRWSAAQPQSIVLIAHGYGEHAGRYEHVAQRLVDDLDATVYAPDHRGHGRTDGATGTVQDGEGITSDLHDVADTAREEHPGLPVALIGHSMGGLVARSAAHQADLDRKVWPTLVRQIVSLGTPHMGAPLEQAVHYASAALHMLPETQPFSRFLRRRSGGIRDLRQGSLVDEDWRDRDPDALRAEACAEVPLLSGVTHCFVTATITRSPRHPLGRLVGDFLVLQASGSGRGRTRRIAFDEEYGHHVGGAHHFALLNHPAVYDKLRAWLTSSSPRPQLGRG